MCTVYPVHLSPFTVYYYYSQFFVVIIMPPPHHSVALCSVSLARATIGMSPSRLRRAPLLAFYLVPVCPPFFTLLNGCVCVCAWWLSVLVCVCLIKLHQSVNTLCSAGCS